MVTYESRLTVNFGCFFRYRVLLYWKYPPNKIKRPSHYPHPDSETIWWYHQFGWLDSWATHCRDKIYHHWECCIVRWSKWTPPRGGNENRASQTPNTNQKQHFPNKCYPMQWRGGQRVCTRSNVMIGSADWEITCVMLGMAQGEIS